MHRFLNVWTALGFGAVTAALDQAGWTIAACSVAAFWMGLCAGALLAESFPNSSPPARPRG